jgi:hypothetical protein
VRRREVLSMHATVCNVHVQPKFTTHNHTSSIPTPAPAIYSVFFRFQRALWAMCAATHQHDHAGPQAHKTTIGTPNMCWARAPFFTHFLKSRAPETDNGKRWVDRR